MVDGLLQAGVLAWIATLVSLAALRLGESMVPALAGVVNLTPDFIVSVMAGALALALELIPGLRARWEVLPGELKRFAWLLGCLLVGAGPWALGCLGDVLGADLTAFSIVGTCRVDTLAQGMQVAFLAYFASQSVHGLSVAGVKVATYLRNRGPQAGAV